MAALASLFEENAHLLLVLRTRQTPLWGRLQTRTILRLLETHAGSVPLFLLPATGGVKMP